MPYKTFVPGEILTAADLMTYLMDQSVVVCTSGTRPSSPPEGMHIYETDTDKAQVWNGSAWSEMMTMGAWASFTHGWNGTVSNGTMTARYVRLAGRLIAFQILFSWGSTSVAPAAPWSFNLPVTAARNHVGAAYFFDNSAGRYWAGAYRASTSTVDRVMVDSADGDAGNPNRSWVLNSNTAPVTWGTGDEVSISGIYEAAAG